MKKTLLALLLISLAGNFSVFAQEEDDDKDGSRQKFEMVYDVETTPVKSQGRTGTCWSFATTSYIETELIRMGKGEFDLSEMFTVRNTYPLKAQKYVRYHGMSNFGEGGQAHDVLNIFSTVGAVPESVYGGKVVDSAKYNNGELQSVLKGILDGVLRRRGGKLSPVWKEVCEAALDIYLGKTPDEFEYDGKTYTPKSFAQSLGLNPEDYVEFTSYPDAPFYSQYELDLPDKWVHELYYNVPIDDIVAIMDFALENGYSVAWDGDVSEKGFDMKKGYAIVPVDKKDDDKKEDKDSDDEDDEELLPEEEKEVTQEIRQDAFNDFTTTDDHLMHTVGLAKNQNGEKFYFTKNSWGEKGKYDGFIYISEPYVRLKTVAIMVHKNAIPDEIKNKLGL